MGLGAICHTLNPRLFVNDLEYIINDAEVGVGTWLMCVANQYYAINRLLHMTFLQKLHIVNFPIL